MLYLNNWQRLHDDRIQEQGCEKFDPISIFERDGWKCWLCGVSVNRLAVHPDSMAPTIDHVIPIAKGGSHTADNVRCAHSICNCRKQTKVMVA